MSRAAVSKWESGRGYPSIDSLKSISKVFTVSIDDLLSNEQLIAIAEDDTKEKVIGLRCVLYGLLDMMGLIFLFVPLFAQVNGDMVQSVSLLKLSLIETSLIRVYIMIICTSVIYGIIEIVLQNYENIFWKKYSPFLSHLITICCYYDFYGHSTTIYGVVHVLDIDFKRCFLSKESVIRKVTLKNEMIRMV